MEVVAVDLGYGYVKVLSSSGQSALFPSVVGTGYERGIMNLFGHTSNGLSDMHVKVQGEEYFVGELAKESRSRSRIFERKRFGHKYTHILLNVAVQLVTSKKTNTVKLITGLPLDFYQSQAKDFQVSISGVQPEIVWKSGPFVNIQRRLNIEHALIFPQGAAAIFAAVMDQNGHAIYPNLMKQGVQIGLIDTGFRTTDFVVVEMQEGGSFVPKAKLSGTVDEGVVNLYRDIQQKYKSYTGGADLNDFYISRILREKQLPYRGRTIDFTQVIEASLQSISANIMDRLKTAWGEESDLFDAIFIAGGGGELFSEYFQSSFDQRLMTIPGSQFANAAGYLRLGEALFGNQNQHTFP